MFEKKNLENLSKCNYQNIYSLVMGENLISKKIKQIIFICLNNMYSI